MYFTNLYNKLSEFGNHHQILFTVIVALCLILISWSIQQILDLYIFKSKKLHGYVAAIILGLAMLWLVQHIILHIL